MKSCTRPSHTGTKKQLAHVLNIYSVPKMTAWKIWRPLKWKVAMLFADFWSGADPRGWHQQCHTFAAWRAVRGRSYCVQRRFTRCQEIRRSPVPLHYLLETCMQTWRWQDWKHGATRLASNLHGLFMARQCGCSLLFLAPNAYLRGLERKLIVPELLEL